MDERQTMHAMMLDDAYCVGTGAGGRRIRRHRNGELDGVGPFVRKKMPLRLARRRLCPHTRRMRFVAAAARRGDLRAARHVRGRYDYVDGVTLDHYVCERDDDNGDGVYGSDVAISLILRDEKGNFVFWRSEYVRKPAKGESRAFSIQIYGLPKYASYEAYAYAS